MRNCIIGKVYKCNKAKVNYAKVLRYKTHSLMGKLPGEYLVSADSIFIPYKLGKTIDGHEYAMCTVHDGREPVLKLRVMLSQFEEHLILEEPEPLMLVNPFTGRSSFL